ncbi:alpha-xenorhabdolysin family binary toxin subunit A [Pseudomonas sp. H9]|uniref:alpha-xenorhabdolysin family binary toxin subunit A n=1 Tax=Pseudomonas sp. H9 TaxID=483968 RepID=UPI0010580BBD|nr:alpha-xenorhabdolysin family binary toxin subunit A [Pseudomonas sp. H9]TDF81694.1 hypothetical protein E1573_16380 [Pseudomonas sp. H9]
MNEVQNDFDTLQQEAEILPKNLIQAMAERDGPEEGGLTLTREHIVTLSEYANYTFTLPTTHDTVVRWLGYSTIASQDLMPGQMLGLNKDLRAHGSKWKDLADNSKRLGFELAANANGINTTGSEIIEILEKTKALGKKNEAWETITFDHPVVLNATDKGSVLDLVDYMTVLREDVDRFAKRVNEVGEETEKFRSEATTVLIPAVLSKSRAIKDLNTGEQIKEMREDLAEIDKRIKQLEAEYDQYVKAALSGLAAGPLGAVITGSIYGSKAEKVRKERNKLQKERGALSQKLKAAVKLEGLVEELGTQMGQTETRLRDVVTAASHLHSAWLKIGTYIDASIEQLKRIENNQQLYKFAIFFKRFIGQWKEIEKFAQHMNRVFDDAASAK